MKRVFITGGAGFIGSHLSEYLLGLGYEVTIVDDLSTGSLSNIEHLQSNPKFHYVIDTIFNDSLMRKLIDESDLVFHLAAAVGVKVIMENPIEAMEINAMGTKNILRHVSCFDGKKIVVASTSEVYGKGVTVPFSEGDDLLMGPTSKGRWSYACAKMMDEFLTLAYCKEFGMEAVVVRFFNTVGPRQSSHYGMVLPRFVKQALNHEDVTVYSDGTQTRCFTHVADVVWALEKLINTAKAVGEVVNIGNPEEVSIIDLAHKIIKRTNSKSDIFHIPYDQVYNQDFEDMKRRIPNIGKINSLIGYEPKHDLNDIIEQIISYFRALQGEFSKSVNVDFKKSKKKKAA